LKKDSPWLASEDIGDTERRVTIEDVSLHKNVTFDKGRVEAKVAALKLSGLEKRMVLNSTNRKSLVRLFGMDTREWRGKAILLWVDHNVRLAGETVCGLRIKEAPPVALVDLPAAWDGWTLEERGENRAGAGTSALEVWWKSLSNADRVALKARLPAWKETAASAA
jgi:hypothetical protein